MELRWPLVAERVREAPGADERLQDLQQLAPRQAAAAPGAQHDRAYVVRAADAKVGPPREDVTRLVGLVEPPPHDEWLGRRLDRLCQPPRWRERGQRREPRAYLWE